MSSRPRIGGAALLLAGLAILALALTGCGPSPSTAKANAQSARKAMDDIVYYDVELLLAPTVVMKTTEPTAVVTTAQAAEMKTWLTKDLAVIEDRAQVLAAMAKGPALGDPGSDRLLADTSGWLQDTYLPAIRGATAEVVAGKSLGAIVAELGGPFAGSTGEQAKARIAALRAALAKKAGS